ncbi:MAG TPA: hypothetical protein VE136_00445, partial [Anaerolineales bacterium]|nr:hypothetical protein [Anaerolineales bacterium]
MINPDYRAIRRPVRRPGADTYLLLTLLSFALSVSLTRLFLELAGYPQLGGGKLHIAHMLWGGLLLFVAAMLPLIFVNRWVYTWVAVLSGVGIGLFIDEIGKFITQNNDYFFPPAAPMIYAFFLICVLLYLRVNRPPPRHPRAELYATLEMMEEVLDHDLDAHERAEIETRLRYVIEAEGSPELRRLARDLLGFFGDEHTYLAPAKPRFEKRLEARLRTLERRHLDQGRLRSILTIGMAVMGAFASLASLRAMASDLRLDQGGTGLTFAVQNATFAHVSWFLSLQVFQFLLGAALILSSVYLMKGRKEGVDISYVALLVYLTMVDLLLFYYYQFSTTITAIVQFILLLGVIYYRQSYAT